MIPFIMFMVRSHAKEENILVIHNFIVTMIKHLHIVEFFQIICWCEGIKQTNNLEGEVEFLFIYLILFGGHRACRVRATLVS
jgi:hypothetical protein